MPEIDLDPKDYRAEPLKGEPVFARGGLLRLAAAAIFLAIAIVVSLLLRDPSLAFSNWLGRF